MQSRLYKARMATSGALLGVAVGHILVDAQGAVEIAFAALGALLAWYAISNLPQPSDTL